MHLTTSTATIARWIGFTLLLAFSSYLWVLPLFRPRGDFLWGHYGLKGIYLGIPVGLALLGMIAVQLSPPNYRRRVALRLLSVSVSVIFTVLVVDVAYALIVKGAARSNFWFDQANIPRTDNAPDDELGFVRKPNASWRGYIKEVDRFVDYRTDQNGFRNSSTEQAVADVVFIGDSFTEAAQVSDDDTFVRRVGAATGLSVVNLGRSGYGPQQELIVLQKYGLTYKPRIVVWQLFEANDLMEAANFAAWKKNPGQSKSSIVDRYFAHSLISRVLAKTRVAEDDDSSTPWIRFSYSDGTTARLPLNFYYDPSQPQKVPVGMDETNRTIDVGHRLCQSHGIQLLVIHIPAMIHVMDPYVAFERETDETRYRPKPTSNDEKDFSGRVAELCEQLGCTFVDSLAVLRQAAATNNRNLYISRDEHLDVRGHELIAQLVADWIRKNDMNRQAGK